MQSLNRDVDEATLTAFSARYVDLNHDALRGLCCVVGLQDVGQTVSYRRSDPKQPEGLDPIKKERVFGEKVG